MAQKIMTTLVDDLDPSGETVATATVSFGLDGASYEVDLSDENQALLRDFLTENFIPFARRVGGRGKAPASKPTRRTSTNPNMGIVRDWANANGFTVGPRGRIPAEVLEAYETKTPNAMSGQTEIEVPAPAATFTDGTATVTPIKGATKKAAAKAEKPAPRRAAQVVAPDWKTLIAWATTMEGTDALAKAGISLNGKGRMPVRAVEFFHEHQARATSKKAASHA